MGAEPKEYKTKFIEPGIMSYEDVGQGSVLLTRDALDRMRKSFIGKPVFNLVHKDYEAFEAFDFKNMSDDEKDKMADGIITDIWTGDDGWDHAKMLIWDEATQNVIENEGYSVSCAYLPTEFNGSGNHHGYDYDEEITNGDYTHMAIVDSPRYERATIYNSKTNKGDNMAGKLFKFFFNEKEEKTEVEPKKENSEDAYMETETGEKIPVAELVKAYMEKQSSDSEPKKLGLDDEIEMENGQKVCMKDLYESYKAMKEKDNAEPPQDDNAEPVVKENSNFKKVKENASNTDKIEISYTTEAKRLERGRSRYGSPVKGDK